MSALLVVHPHQARRTSIQKSLEQAGYQTLFANNCEIAYQIFKNYSVDLIICELELPTLSCFDLVKKIRADSSINRTPVLVLTSKTNQDDLTKILEMGANDFLQEPYSEDLFLTKINLLLRLKNLNTKLLHSNKVISTMHKNLELEHKSAERIFERFVHGPGKKVPGLETRISPFSIFNGDVFLSTVMPSGNLLLLLGDFTGHGLPASIGAIPVAEVFYSMVKRGRTPSEVLSVINEKLKDILPTHIFFGCIMLNIQPAHKTVAVFNAGMQPVIQLTGNVDNVVQRYDSTSPPLGILKNSEMNFEFKQVLVTDEDVFVFYTDGIIEAMNAQKEMFGVERLISVLATDPSLSTLVSAVSDYSGETAFEDDVSLIKLTLRDVFAMSLQDLRDFSQTDRQMASKWRLEFDFYYSVIKVNDNPIEGVVDAIMLMQPLISFKEDLYSVVSGLYHHAVDQGLLGLDSGIKGQVDGARQFNVLKQQRMDDLSAGKVTVTLRQKPLTFHSAEIEIRISCGEGSCLYFEALSEAELKSELPNQGLLAVKNLCQSLVIEPEDSAVVAVYVWQQ